MFDVATGEAYRSVPADLEEIQAGAALGSVLDAFDPITVSPHDRVRLLVAHRRQLSYQQSAYYDAVREVALADPESPGGRLDREFCPHGDEVRSALWLSRTAADKLLALNDALVRHPDMRAAFAAGELDLERVTHIVRETAPLATPHAQRVVSRVLPEAAEMTYSTLIERCRELAQAYDKEWASRREANARRQRRVRARANDSGTVNIHALDLPLSGGVRSTRYMNLLAARVKALGHPGKIDTIRADVYLARWDPANSGATDEQIIAQVLANADPAEAAEAEATADAPDLRAHDDPGDGDGDQMEEAADRADDDRADDDRADDDRADESGAGETCADEERGDGYRGGQGAEEWLRDAADADAEVDLAGLVEPEFASGTDGEHTDAHDAPAAPVGLGRLPRQARLELRVRLTTLLGRDGKPSRMPGWGSIPGELAVQVTAEHADAEWRVAITDDTGHLEAAVLLRARPSTCSITPQEPAFPGAPRAIIELHVGRAELATLRPELEPEWDTVLREIRREYERWRRSTGPPQSNDESERDRRARFPHAALRRMIEMRDRGCVYPPCRMPAVSAEIDHTVPWALGGATEPGNLGPACRHDHDLKDGGGWRLEQPRPGYFVWTSPTGHSYPRPPQPVLGDLPDTETFDPPSYSGPDQRAGDGPMWEEGAPRTPPDPPSGPTPAPTPAPTDGELDEPPF